MINDIYNSSIMKYGILPFRHAIELLSDIEHYEKAEKANDALKEYCKKYDIEYPKLLTDIEDYKLEFWRLGLGGETAAANYGMYVVNCFNEISNHKI